MKPAATLGLYAGALVLVFAAAVGVGNAVGPVGTAGTSTPTHSTDTHSTDTHSTDTHSTDDADPADITHGGVAHTAELIAAAPRSDESSGHEPQP